MDRRITLVRLAQEERKLIAIHAVLPPTFIPALEAIVVTLARMASTEPVLLEPVSLATVVQQDLISLVQHALVVQTINANLVNQGLSCIRTLEANV